MTKIKLLIFILFMCSTAWLLYPLPVDAQSQTGTFTVSPSSAIITQDNTQTYAIAINTGGHSVIGADAIINFPKDLVDVEGVTNGGFFSNSEFSSAVDVTNGRIELHAFIFVNDGKSGTGTFATFRLKAKSGTGSGSLTFICTGTPASKMLDENGDNVLACTSLSSASFSLTSANPAATPTPTPTPTPQPTATQAPQPPGNIDPTCSGLTLTPSTGPGPLETTLLCTGNDTDGNVTAAEFMLGDGRVQLIPKTIGSSGTISMNARYENAGSFAIACRIRDNVNRFSSIPTSCIKTLDITNPTPTKTATTHRLIAAPTKKPDPYTPQIVDLTPYRGIVTPTAIPVEPIVIDDSELLTKKSESFPRALIGLGIILGSLALGGWFILTSRKHNVPPPPPPQPPTSESLTR